MYYELFELYVDIIAIEKNGNFKPANFLPNEHE